MRPVSRVSWTKRPSGKVRPCTVVQLYRLYIAKKEEKFNYTSVRTVQSRTVSGNQRQAPQDGEEKKQEKKQEKRSRVESFVQNKSKMDEVCESTSPES